ncbi:hypothetical protein [uncultured Winogradskyella sp.]|uniref:hypothetical protein n=1 Tax=uncultured Winogradskyella sp. TaxID=395353 RepID=UPI0024398967|nr:hypothetical protein [uncultured Winogradskyella sp.]
MKTTLFIIATLLFNEICYSQIPNDIESFLYEFYFNLPSENSASECLKTAKNNKKLSNVFLESNDNLRMEADIIEHPYLNISKRNSSKLEAGGESFYSEKKGFTDFQIKFIEHPDEVNISTFLALMKQYDFEVTDRTFGSERTVVFNCKICYNDPRLSTSPISFIQIRTTDNSKYPDNTELKVPAYVWITSKFDHETH